MTFLERFQNVCFYSLVQMARRWLAGSVFDGVAREYLGEGVTTQSVMSRTTLWLYQTDPVLDFPRPAMPNMVPVGGLNVREVAPLSEDLEAFIQSSGQHGVVIVSFGSIVKTMESEQIEVFTAAFARLRQKVVWRYTGEKPAGLGHNTKLMAWLPQNDLLGHPKTRVFITHAGYNGVCEALHHGVPMVCLPQFGDHPGNAAQVVARGLGVKLDINRVTSDELYQAILYVLNTNSYRETAVRLSRLHRDQPQSPMERAVWWIEHVIKHGGLPHLRARAVELPWYQYYLLDVATFLLAVCAAVLGAVWYSCSFIYGKCCSKSERKLKSQ
ncbi:UDP-glucuronosyltransferase 2C1-like [Branchiostoma floridae]|uniref:UDP-glucuronosyltransferase n=1 Tax=Branchiostoma floridae TaxID=7739 RepID=A0A9J7M216_BRAFL|nr:UDP-glucuronosyltransferase 2C1-like [Branchiostoma floridae]